MSKVDFICPAPFVSNVQWAYGMVKMCCNDNDTEGDDLEEAWNSSKRMKARSQWLKGEVPDRCKSCVSGQLNQNGIELIGHYRSQFPSFEPEHCDEDGRMRAGPKYLHLSPHNTCQLACRMCMPEVSTSYGKLFNGKAIKTDNRASTIEYVKSVAHQLQNYVFHGGEPMNDDSFIDILNILHPYRNQMRISVLSNGMSLKSRGKDVISVLKEFPKLEYMLSIDGTPEVNEHQRELSNTARMIANYNRLASEIPHAEVRVNQTLTNLTIANMPAFYRYLNDNLVRIDGLNHGNVTYPLEYQPFNVPEAFRTRILENILSIEEGELKPALAREARKLKVRAREIFDRPFDSELWAKFQKEERDKNRVVPVPRDTMRIFTEQVIPSRSVHE